VQIRRDYLENMGIKTFKAIGRDMEQMVRSPTEQPAALSPALIDTGISLK
jgi:hypothetical protein